MKKLFVNGVCLFVAVLSGVLLFVLKYQVKEEETTLKKIHLEILRNKREIHMLEADWAHLNDPQRLQALVNAQTDWKTIRAEQLVRLSDLPMRPARIVVSDAVDEVEQEKVAQKKSKSEATVQKNKKTKRSR